MAMASMRHDWQQTVSVMAMVNNSNCTDKRSLIKDPSKLMPAHLRPSVKKRTSRPLSEGELGMLREMYPGKKGKS